MIGVLLLMIGIFLVFSLLGYEPFKSILESSTSSFGGAIETCCCLGGIVVLFLLGVAMMVSGAVRGKFRLANFGGGIFLVILSILLFINTYTSFKMNWWVLVAFGIVILGILAIARAFRKRSRPSTWREWMTWNEWFDWD